MSRLSRLRKLRKEGKLKKWKYSLEDVLPENWEQIILKLCDEGCCEEEIWSELCVERDDQGKYKAFNNKMWDRLEAREADLARVLQKGRKLCKAWWIKQGHRNIKNSFFNTALWFINMKNRFGWKDKTEIEHGLSDVLLEKFSGLSTEQLKERAHVLIENKSSS